MAKVNPKYATPKAPPLMQPCCVCGEVIKAGKYHTVGGPGCVARGIVWANGLYTHLRCKVGTKKWFKSLGSPTPGFEGLFDEESDRLYYRLYSTVAGWEEDDED